VNPERLQLLPAGVHLDAFPLLERDAARESLQLPIDKKILGFVGFSLWDLELLAEAFARVKQEFADAVLLIIGGGVEEQAKEVFRQRFQIDREVIMPGVVPFEQVPHYLAACDIQLLPMQDTLANRARVPNKLTDYYASARPVVTCDVGDAGTYVREHQTGLVTPPEAVPFGNACLELLRDEERSRQCGLRARRIAQEQWSYKGLTQRLIQFYEEIASKTT
jgi:teichuronic acid biosynthesis glycosyltransferase TuaC